MKNAIEIREMAEKAKIVYDTQQKILARGWMENQVAESIEKAALDRKEAAYIPIPAEIRDYYDFIVNYLRQFGYRVKRSANDLVVFWTE